MQRRNARGGRGAAEHLIGALQCMYRYLVADGILTQAENPAARAEKPRRLRSARMALPDGCGSFGVTGVGGMLRVGEASVPMVLMCEVRIAEGKPQVEGYAAGELAASADLAGPLAGMLAALVREVAGPGAAGLPLEELERRVVAGVRTLGCAVLQHALDARAGAEVRLAGVAGRGTGWRGRGPGGVPGRS